MDGRYVGSHVDVIRPATGEALGGVCVAKTGDGWIIEAEDEQVFGTTTVVAWLRGKQHESVVQAKVRPVNGPFFALKTTGTLLRVSHGREDRYPVEGVVVTCGPNGEEVELHVVNLSCHGFGFFTTENVPTDPILDLDFSVADIRFTLPGTIAHISAVAPGLYRGGVSLKLQESNQQRQWLAIIATCATRAA